MAADRTTEEHAVEPAPIKPTIPFEQLEGIDIRVGTVVSVSEVPERAVPNGTRAG